MLGWPALHPKASTHPSIPWTLLRACREPSPRPGPARVTSSPHNEGQGHTRTRRPLNTCQGYDAQQLVDKDGRREGPENPEPERGTPQASGSEFRRSQGQLSQRRGSPDKGLSQSIRCGVRLGPPNNNYYGVLEPWQMDRSILGRN